MFFRCFSLLLALLALSVPTTHAATTTTGGDAEVLEPVLVIGTAAGSDASGSTSLDAEQLSIIPARNGSLAESLTVAPGIQYSDGGSGDTFALQDSALAGEILPPVLSISGGRFYQNNISLDGFSNNSLLDPVETDVTLSLFKTQGHPQELFVNPRLIEQVTVYDSNVPAEYGRFTGGVVDAELMRPAKTFSGSVFYRTTRDEWTSFHIDPADWAAFQNSNSDAAGQPRFEKHDAGAILNLPLTDDSGLILSYQQLYSQIPLLHFGETKNQHRRLENVFAKYGHDFGAGTYGELSLLYTPYAGKYFRKETVASDYEVQSGGLLLGARWEQRIGSAFWELQAGYRHSENTRAAPQHLWGWAVTPAKPWGATVGSTVSYEGGLGDLMQTQQAVQLKSDLSFDPISVGATTHTIKTGFDLELIRGEYDRPHTTYQFYRYTGTTGIPNYSGDPAPESSVTCGPWDIACVPGEQYLNRRLIFDAARVSARMNLIGLYLQDTLDWKRLELRAGLRVSYDDFMKNLTAAPRLSATYDLFDDAAWRLIAGWNRYYGKTLLSYKLREAVPPSGKQEARGMIESPPASGIFIADQWANYSDGSTVYRFSEAKTPYKDEFTFAVEGRLFEGQLEVRYINREGRDEFARERVVIAGDFNQYRLTNNGRSSYHAVICDWERTWEKAFLKFNTTWQETTTGNESYFRDLSVSQLTRMIWYDGELFPWDERPREDFNRPWLANLIFSVDLGHGFNFTNYTKYRSPYFALQDTFVNSPIDGNDIYERVRQPSSTLFDWVVAWQSPELAAGQYFVLSAEVYNVFNRRVHLGEEENEFELGRQFWAGIEYRF